jgi:two-component system, LuxR family, response regulator FixJ
MSSEPLIHVIDDDEAARESLEFLLRSARLEVRTYDSAKRFLENVQEIEGGCIITDIRMPEISGVELLRRLKELQVNVPVIVVTGHGDVQLAVGSHEDRGCRLSREAVR